MKIAYANNQWTKAQKQACVHIPRPGEAARSNAAMENAFEKMFMGPKGKEVLQGIEQRARDVRFQNDCKRKQKILGH